MLTDLNIHTEPTLPTLGAAGTKFTDPVFGSEILRVTDANNAPATGSINGAMNAYSTQQSFNCDNTRIGFLVTSGYNRFKVFDFDPVNFTVNTTGAILSSPPAGLQEYGMCWHNSNPDLIYGVGNYNLYEINWQTGSSSTLKTFTGLGHTGGYVTQMNMSSDNNIFAMRFEGGTGIGYVVWKRSTDTILMSAATLAGLDEVEVDKSGIYGIFVYDDGSAEVYTLSTGVRIGSALTGNLGFNHRDARSNGIFTHRPANTSIGFRTCDSPTSIVDLLPNMTNGWSYSTTQDHFCAQENDANGFVLASRYRSNGAGVVKAFDNEILKIAVDGSNNVQRLCHHRSVFAQYNDSPFASCSFDGEYINFSSNWGNSAGRRDGFIVRAEVSSPQPRKFYPFLRRR